MPKALRGTTGTTGTAGSAGYPVVTNASNLPASPRDGQGAIVRLGSGSGMQDIILFYNATLSKWVGTEEHVMFYCNDIDNLTVTAPFTSLQYVPNTTTIGYWTNTPLPKAGLGYSAGLTLQYREAYLGQSSTDGKNITALTSFYQYDSGDSTTSFTIPIAGYIAQTGGVNGSAPAVPDSFRWVENGWNDLTFTTTPTKSTLYGVICAAMDAGASSNGHFVDYTCILRWVK